MTRLVEVVSSARCLTRGCTWGPAGGPWEIRGSAEAVEREARRHSGEGQLTGGPTPGHGTMTHHVPRQPTDAPP